MADEDAANDDRGKATIDLRARAGNNDERQHPEHGGQRTREDRTQPRLETRAHGVDAAHAFGFGLAGAGDKQDRVVDDEPEHNDEPDHGEQIERLEREEADELERRNAADRAE